MTWLIICIVVIVISVIVRVVRVANARTPVPPGVGIDLGDFVMRVEK